MTFNYSLEKENLHRLFKNEHTTKKGNNGHRRIGAYGYGGVKPSVLSLSSPMQQFMYVN